MKHVMGPERAGGGRRAAASGLPAGPVNDDDTQDILL